MSTTDSGRRSGTKDDQNDRLTGTNTPLRDPSQPGGGKKVPRSDATATDAAKPRGQRLSAGDRDARRDEDEDDSRGNR